MFFKKKTKIKNLEAEMQALSTQNLQLQNFIAQAGGVEAFNTAYAAQQAQYAHTTATRQLAKIQNRITEETNRYQELTSTLESEYQQRKTDLDEIKAIYEETNELLEAGITNYNNPAQSSMTVGVELDVVKARIKDMIRDKTAVTACPNFTFNDSAAKGKKFTNDMSKMMLRAYNAEAENCVLKAKAGNGESARKRLERCREQVQRLGSMIDLNISWEYHKLRLEELSLTIEYQNAKKREKEEERERRAQLREEQRAQAELEREKEKLVKQKTHYENVLQKLLDQGKKDEAQAYEEKINGIEKDIAEVDYRAANTSAGYVYVISNIGSFGEGMVKIGMTRRLEPLDRIRELSDASVPFNFDVHALFFSENASGVEAQLHRHFADRRVNLVNQRREFFAVPPAEVKEVLKDISGDLLEFIDVPDAEQYRLSEQIRKTL